MSQINYFSLKNLSYLDFQNSKILVSTIYLDINMIQRIQTLFLIAILVLS